MSTSKMRWGIDLGGTKIEGVILPDGSSKPVCRLRVPTEADQGYEHIISQMNQLIIAMEAESGLTRPEVLGLGTPGNSDPDTGFMKNANTVCLIGKPLILDAEMRLGLRIRAANDANCFALAEAIHGAGKGSSVVFGVIMGTGVGGGLVVDGKVLNGRMSIAGEWGHNVLEPDGAPCYCGKVGCVETVLSGPGLERWHREQGGDSIRLPEIASRATNGEGLAQRTMARLTEKFGEALSVVINIVDPDVVVLGGGVGNIPALYKEGVEALSRWVFNDSLQTSIRAPMLGDSAGVFGAAMLVP
jgi:predicted NBD/HSP70 family sugar kinase